MYTQHGRLSGEYLAFCSAALFVLLAGTARTKVIPSDFGGTAHDLLHRLLLARSSHACTFEFATFPPLKIFFNFIDGSCDRTRGAMPVAASAKTRGWGSSLATSKVGRSGRATSGAL